MKGYTLLVTLFCFYFVSISNGQNLVLNPGFENYIACPGFGQFGPSWVNDWNKPSYGSSDYYHYSCTGINPPLGSNPHSGNAEAGIILYNYGTEYREYITATLSQPLIANKNYYVEFYLALNIGYIQAIQEAGAWFSDSLPGPFANSLTINVTPQVTNSGGFISYGWSKISGNYIATGGELYLTLGNFSNDSNTTISQVGNSGSYGSYYFVDDVFVGAGDSVPQSVTEPTMADIPYLPAMVSAEQLVSINFKGGFPLQLEIYSLQGIKIKSFAISKESCQILIPWCVPGIYLYEFKNKQGLLSNGKVIVTD